MTLQNDIVLVNLKKKIIIIIIFNIINKNIKDKLFLFKCCCSYAPP